MDLLNPFLVFIAAAISHRLQIENVAD